MTHARLATVLSEIIDVLEKCGRADRADWLKERLALLEDVQATADAREHAANELHGVVLGMGGLMDLTLDPGPGSSYTPQAARKKLDTLSDTLYDLTR